MVRPARLERATFWFVAKRSIQLSYGRDRVGLKVILARSCVRNAALGNNFPVGCEPQPQAPPDHGTAK